MKIDFEELKKDSTPIVGAAKYHFEKRKNLYVYAILTSFLLHLAYSSYVSYNSDESKRLRTVEYHQGIKDEAVKDLSSSVTKTLRYKAQLAYAEACLEANEESYLDCSTIDAGNYEVKFVKASTGTVIDKPETSMIPKASAAEAEPPSFLKPEELFGPTKVSDRCYVTQTESNHVRPERGGMFATDIACNFGEGLGKRAEVYAPDLRDKSVNFRVEHVGNDALLGSFVQLVVTNGGQALDESFYLGHTETKLKEGDFVRTGQRIGQMTMDGVSTGWHVHFEYRRLSANGTAWKSERYFTGAREEALDNKRKGQLPAGWKWGDKFYFTHYTLGDPNQNDSTPCHGASGKDLCALEKSGVRTIALTVDVRNALGIKFGDKVKLEGPCSGTYEVHDEMNYRFRYGCVKRDGLCIKGDIPSCGGGAHSIHKL